MRRSITFMLASISFLFVAAACGGSNSDCRGHCDSAHVTCRQRCTDDACRTACDVDLDSCNGGCVTYSGDSGPR